MDSKEKIAEEKEESQEVSKPLLNEETTDPPNEETKKEQGDSTAAICEIVGDVQWWGEFEDKRKEPVSVSQCEMTGEEPFKTEGRVKHPTSYIETLIHVLKGNIGSGMFAMGEAFKHAGLLMGTILTFILGIICIYNNHILIKCARYIQERKKIDSGTSFSATVELCFLNGPPIFKKFTNLVRRLVIGFVITTQFGFCCVYVVLVASTLHKVVKHYGAEYDDRIYMLMIFLPILITCLITSLKFLAPISLGSNVCVIGAVFLTLYVACGSGLPSPSTRYMVADISELPLFVGTVIYAFEGIGLILPLRNEMKKPQQFGGTVGVLNAGLSIVMVLLITVGFLGFLKYGENVKGSLSLNIPPDNAVGIVVQIVFAIGIGFSFPLQFYVAADIVWEVINEKWGPYKNFTWGKLMTRILLVICIFIVAAVVPNVGLFISLIGAVCSTALALVFPALSDIAIRYAEDNPLRTKYHGWRILMDVITLIIAVLGFATGSYCSIKDIVEAFVKKSSIDGT